MWRFLEFLCGWCEINSIARLESSLGNRNERQKFLDIFSCCTVISPISSSAVVEWWRKRRFQVFCIVVGNEYVDVEYIALMRPQVVVARLSTQWNWNDIRSIHVPTVKKILLTGTSHYFLCHLTFIYQAFPCIKQVLIQTTSHSLSFANIQSLILDRPQVGICIGTFIYLPSSALLRFPCGSSLRLELVMNCFISISYLTCLICEDKWLRHLPAQHRDTLCHLRVFCTGRLCPVSDIMHLNNLRELTISVDMARICILSFEFRALLGLEQLQLLIITDSFRDVLESKAVELKKLGSAVFAEDSEEHDAWAMTVGPAPCNDLLLEELFNALRMSLRQLRLVVESGLRFVVTVAKHYAHALEALHIACSFPMKGRNVDLLDAKFAKSLKSLVVEQDGLLQEGKLSLNGLQYFTALQVLRIDSAIMPQVLCLLELLPLMPSRDQLNIDLIGILQFEGKVKLLRLTEKPFFLNRHHMLDIHLSRLLARAVASTLVVECASTADNVWLDLLQAWLTPGCIHKLQVKHLRSNSSSDKSHGGAKAADRFMQLMQAMSVAEYSLVFADGTVAEQRQHHNCSSTV